ncbi:MAG: S9 family peptidase [Bacteroidota bacterium]
METIVKEPQHQLPGDPKLPDSSEELKALIGTSHQDHKYSVEDFFKNPERIRYQLSPDGNYFSYMSPYKRRQNIFVQKIGSAASVRITHETDRSINSYFWASNDRILYVKDSGGDENFQLYAVDKDGANPKDLTPFKEVTIQIIDQLEDFEDEVLIEMNKNNPQLFEPYRINIHTGAYEQIAENANIEEPIDIWMTDHNGQLRLANKVTGGTNNTLMYRESEDAPFREVITTDFRVSIMPLFFDFDNGSVIYAASNLNRDKLAIVKFDMATGKEVGPPLFVHPEVDVEELTYSKKHKILTAIQYNTAKRNYHFLDPKRASLYKRLEEQLGDHEISFASMNKAEDKFMIRTYSDRSLGSYIFYDAEKDELQKIADVSPWIDEADMSEMKPIRYTSRDGLTINGYLTLPKGLDPQNLPVIINPHGGPWFRDYWGFNPEIQLLASRGYAVLQMNFRGSTGYGRDFWEKSFKQWGRTMQDDITDGVHWLIEQGIADPKRVGIYGGSYGGYAVLAGLTYTPDLYACGVDYVGVSNLFTFMKTMPPYWKPFQEMMFMMVGNPEQDKEEMAAASPALHADKIKAPLFVVQGANDPRVNIDESDQIVREIRGRGIEVPYMVKYNEGHGFHNEENRFELYKLMLGFFDRHLKS